MPKQPTAGDLLGPPPDHRNTTSETKDLDCLREECRASFVGVKKPPLTTRPDASQDKTGDPAAAAEVHGPPGW